MKKRLINHGIAVIGIAVFAFLAIASSVTSASAPTPAPVSGGTTTNTNNTTTTTSTNTNASTVNAGFPCTGSWKVTGRDSKSWMGDLVITGFNGNGFAGYFAWHYSPGNEFVGYENFAGEYNPQSGAVTIRGFSVTDSSRLAVGEYQARLSGNNLNLVSGTWKGDGVWQANFVSRDAPAQGSTGTVATQPPGPTSATPSPVQVAQTAQGNNLTEKLDWLKAFVQSNSSYILDVNADESIGDQELSYSGKSNVTITLRGIGANRTISRSSGYDMFIVGSGITLILENNITLRDRRTSDTGSRLISVETGGKLIMNNGSTVTGNTGAYEGGGIRLNGGTFTMNGGTISNNRGHGVSLSYGTFTMNDGTISGNSSGGVSLSGRTTAGGARILGNFTMTGGTISNNRDSGVHVGGGAFTMSNGTISGNTASSSSSNPVYGGGVYVLNSESSFTMSGGEISGNTVSGGYGGGVSVGGYSSGTFIMNGGKISGNTATATTGGTGRFGGNGGGVYVGGMSPGGTFTMNNGTISGNTVSTNGGGVYVYERGSFTMRNGTVSGNTARENGGGVNVDQGTFAKTGGTITGYASDQRNGNAVKNSSGAVQNYLGHAVYAPGPKIKEGTAGPGDNMSFNNNTASGAWDN